MDFIKQLVENRYDIFNVDEKKVPMTKNGGKMAKWQLKTFDELVANHNYTSQLWGLRLGEQTNGKCSFRQENNILSYCF